MPPWDDVPEGDGGALPEPGNEDKAEKPGTVKGEPGTNMSESAEGDPPELDTPRTKGTTLAPRVVGGGGWEGPS